ncbi:recombinase family protein [Methylobacterium sp. B4]|uniref:recombinase family protein n=1 Tax=Methylobacterium sp. B4 TaxID=1938755 RepID=UPI000D76DC06|nr:recombinase family protein [Methylobacterium sp. B4]PXW67130.1 DNA invertase Pin-like site-specific DNA recombinase [Methylobacterium sp. B4]
MIYRKKEAAELTRAVAYFRTSSASNVGSDKDSERRQREAVIGYARQAGIEIVAEFYDASVSGADPIDARPGFAEMLKRIESNGVRTIVVETANRFARDLMVQEVGYSKLRERGISLIAADSPNAFLEDTPTANLVRQILGAISEFDKAITVAKLRGARDRQRATGRKVEGRKGLVEREGGQALAAEARRLHRVSPKTGKRRSLREIALILAEQGHVSSSGLPFAPSVVQRLLSTRASATLSSVPPP